MFPEFHIDAERRVETLKARRKGVTNNFYSSKIKPEKEMKR